MGVERWTQAAGLTFVAAAAKARQPLLTAEPEHDGLGGYRSQRSPQTESGRTPVPCSMQKEYPFGYSFFIQRNRAQVRFLPYLCRRHTSLRRRRTSLRASAHRCAVGAITGKRCCRQMMFGFAKTMFPFGEKSVKTSPMLGFFEFNRRILRTGRCRRYRRRRSGRG